MKPPCCSDWLINAVKSEVWALPSSAELRSAVSPIFNRQGLRSAAGWSAGGCVAECNSAIRQIENLRYFSGEFIALANHWATNRPSLKVTGGGILTELFSSPCI
jgi:hypothetical protein